MNLYPKKPQVFILLFLFSFSNFLGLMYSAALPDLSVFFQIDKGGAQFTIILFLVGFSAGQLLYAPLSCAIGRKPALYIGCLIAIFGSVLCVLGIEFTSFRSLLIGRFITALGSACSLSLTFTIVSDAYTHFESRKIISFLVGGLAFFPAVGIVIGGLLTHYFSWQFCFYFMLFYSVFVMGICTLLPETLHKIHPNHFHPLKILKIYVKQANHFIFLFCSLILGIGGGVVYIFATQAPYIAINQLKLSANLFGILNLVPFFGLFIGGCLSGYLCKRFNSLRLILIGTMIYLIFSVLMLLAFYMDYVNVSTLFLFPFIIFLSFPMIFSSSSLLGLAVSANKSYASSLINSIQIMIAVVILFAISRISSQEAYVLPLIYSIIGVVLVVLWMILKGLLKNHPEGRILDEN